MPSILLWRTHLMINLPMRSLERFLLIRAKKVERANAPQSSNMTINKPLISKPKKRTCGIKPKHQSIKVNSIAAQACSVSYPRNDRDAHAEALDEHERLIKQGWEFLRNQMKGDEWVSTYVKLPSHGKLIVSLVILSPKAYHWFALTLLQPAANQKDNRDDCLIDSMQQSAIAL